MKLLVGIPTHRRPELLRDCLASIAAQEGDLPSVALFVADNDPARCEGRKVVEELVGNFRFPVAATTVEEPGISAVRNAILDEARSRQVDFIAMIDDDETASPQWLARLLEVQAAYGADVVGGPVSRDVPRSAPRWMRQEFFRSQTHVTGPIELIDGTGNVLLNCASLERFGWPRFDPAFGLTGGEDAEWFLRLASMGAAMAWAADAEAFEFVPPERATFSWLWRRNIRIGINQIQLAKQRRQSRTLLLMKAMALLVLVPVFAIRLVSPNRRADTVIRWSRAVGRMGGVLGLRYFEYAERHDATRKTR